MKGMVVRKSKRKRGGTARRKKGKRKKRYGGVEILWKRGDGRERRRKERMVDKKNVRKRGNGQDGS